jgi:hypothetical protein
MICNNCGHPRSCHSRRGDSCGVMPGKGCKCTCKLFVTVVDTSAATIVQPPPKPAVGPAIWDLVIKDCIRQGGSELVDDMRARDALGCERYGIPLRAHDGRDTKIDAFQEALDLIVYAKKAAVEATDDWERMCMEQVCADAKRLAMTLKLWIWLSGK